VVAPAVFQLCTEYPGTSVVGVPPPEEIALPPSSTQPTQALSEEEPGALQRPALQDVQSLAELPPVVALYVPPPHRVHEV